MVMIRTSFLLFTASLVASCSDIQDSETLHQKTFLDPQLQQIERARSLEGQLMGDARNKQQEIDRLTR